MLTFEPTYFIEILQKLLTVVPFTFYVVLISALCCVIGGIVVSAIRIRKIPVLYEITNFWLSFVRSMPFVLLLFLMYFLVPFLLKVSGLVSSGLDKITYVYITMAFAYAPVIAEVIRPVYFSIEKGQREAVVVFGMTPLQSMIHVVLPQMIPSLLPPLVNQLIEIVKDTSLMYMIGLMDLMGRANLLITVHQGIGKLESYVAVAVLYWIMVAALESLMKYLENRQTRILTRRIS